MLRPYRLETCSRLEPFGQTEPHQPILLRPVERMHDVHLSDGVSQQVQAERDAGAPDQLPRAPEDLGLGVVGPGDAGIIEDARLDGQDAVIAAAGSQQAKRGEAQLDIADEHPAAPELIEHGTRAPGGIPAFAYL